MKTLLWRARIASALPLLVLFFAGLAVFGLHRWAENTQRQEATSEFQVREFPADTIFIEKGGVVVFYDNNYPREPGGPTDRAVNSVGFVTSDFEILVLKNDVLFGLRIDKYHVGDLADLENVSSHTTPLKDIGEQVGAYFKKYRFDPFAIYGGKTALFHGNPDIFIRGELRPIYPKYNSQAHRDEAWEKFKSSLKPGDRIVTFDHSSVISHIIAWATRGPWSHLAIYLGDGQISEFVTSGLREVSLEIYRSPNYSLGSYRYIDLVDKELTREEVLATSCCDPTPGMTYDYVGAITASWHAFNGDFVKGVVPNSMMYLGTVTLVALH